MKRFLLLALAVAVLAGSANAADPSAATVWTCTSQTSKRAEYVVNGNELKEREEACQRNHPALTLGPDRKISSETLPTDPCEPQDRESYTFTIKLNNPDVLIAVSPAAGRDNTLTWVAKRMIVLDKLTGHYTETLLSTPTLARHIAGNEYGGTCDVKLLGSPNSDSSVLDDSQNLVPAVEEEKKPQKKSDTRKAHVHVRRHDHHYKHGHRHNHHPKTNIPPHDTGRPKNTQPDRP